MTAAWISLCTAAMGQPIAPVALHEGRNELMDIGRYEVAYKGPDGAWNHLPTGWAGHFLADVGVSCTEWRPVSGKRTLLLHCPWMRSTGPVELRYLLAVPDVRPVTLTFGYLMSPDETTRSDGVTFTVRAESPDGALAAVEVLAEHTRSTAWTDVSVDLSDFAGRDLLLVFGAAPGPSNDASFDFSLYGDPVVTVGPAGAGNTPAERLAEVRAVRDRWEPAKPRLADLLARSDQGVVPSTGGRYANTVRSEGGSWVFECRGDQWLTHYVLDSDCDLADLECRAEGAAPLPLNGESVWTMANGERGAWRALSVASEGETLVARGVVTGGGQSAEVTLRIRGVGRSLVIQAESSDPAIQSFTAPAPGPVARRRGLSFPYLATGRYWYLPDTGQYISSVLDWTASNAARHDGATAYYDALSDGSRLPLRETAVVAVSPFVHEVFPNIPNPRSPWLDDLARRVVVDDWNGSFASLRVALDQYASHGVRDLLVQVHVWQNAGYDAKLPDVLPANEQMGGDAEMVRLADTARRHGYLFGVHENYVDLYPDAPSWDESLVARDAAGRLIPAWYNPGTGVQSFAYRADAIVPTARRFTPEVHRRYGTTCSFIDVHSAVPPWFHVDYTAGDPIAGRFSATWEAHLELWRLFREVHGGPVLGEGNCHMFWGGHMDGAEAQVNGYEAHQLYPDFDLLKMHPLAAHHGMGYYERWLHEGYAAGQMSRMPLVRADKYRTQEILYGHAGFIGSAWVLEPLLAVKECHMLAPLQARYVPANVADIAYLVAGEWVDASTALPLGETAVVRVTYDNGLEVLVNQSEETIEWRGRRIPQYGFHAHGGGIEEAYIALDGDQVVDYVADESTVFADARSLAYHPRLAGQSRAPVRALPATVEPIGPRRFNITYNWAVEGDPPVTEPAVRACFVHFVNEEVATRPDGIVFQDDHALPAPLSTWVAGTSVAVGPHSVTVPQDVPAGEYRIMLGLLANGARQTIMGPHDGTQRYEVGRLIVAEDGSISSLGPTERAHEADPWDAYDERYNTARRVVDFGQIVTDAAAKVVREPDGTISVYPLPQEMPFTLGVRPGLLGHVGDRFEVGSRDARGAVVESVTVTARDGVVDVPTGRPGVCSYVIAALR